MWLGWRLLARLLINGLIGSSEFSSRLIRAQFLLSISRSCYQFCKRFAIVLFVPSFVFYRFFYSFIIVRILLFSISIFSAAVISMLQKYNIVYVVALCKSNRVGRCQNVAECLTKCLATTQN